MDNNELVRISDLIWSTLNTVDNQDLSKDEQINLIKPIIMECHSSSRKIGRRQILNHLDEEIKHLRQR